MRDKQTSAAASELPEAWQGVAECAAPGCMGFACGDRLCARCREEVDALDRMAGERKAQTWEERVPDWAYKAGALAAWWWLVWEMRSFVWGCIALWFGK